MSDQVKGNPANQQNTEAVAEALELLTRPVTQSMRLDVFERDFLPFFDLRGIEKEVVDEMLDDITRNCEGIRKTEKALIQNVMNNWLSKVRSPFLETNIIDREGNIVFVVPAILRSPENPVDLPAAELFQRVETGINMYNVLPQSGNNFFRNNILPYVKEGKMEMKEYLQWNKIFDHYGMPRYTLPGEEVAAAKAAEVASQQDPDAESSYDFE